MKEKQVNAPGLKKNRDKKPTLHELQAKTGEKHRKPQAKRKDAKRKLCVTNTPAASFPKPISRRESQDGHEKSTPPHINGKFWG